MSRDTWVIVGAVAVVGVLVLVLRGGSGSAPRIVGSTLSVSGGGDPARTSALQSVYGSALNLLGSERRAVISASTQRDLARLGNERARYGYDTQLKIAREQRGAQREQSIIRGVGSFLESLNPLSWF